MSVQAARTLPQPGHLLPCLRPVAVTGSRVRLPPPVFRRATNVDAPKNAWREEPWWHWSWPGRPVSQLSGNATAQVLREDYGATGALKAVIYLPDPDSQTGWQLHKVFGESPSDGSR